MQTPPDSPRLQCSNGLDSRIGLVLADHIRLTRVLGTGAYGTVYQAHDINTNEVYAVKALNKLGLDARQQRFQKREVELHYRASCHPNVLSMYRIIDSADCTYVVLEYCPEGDLFAKITEEGHYVRNDAKVRSVFLQLLKAVEYCHSLSIYHRDLKPENIMVADNGNTIRLGDFGLATRDAVSRDFGCGSTFYMSPECQEVNPGPNSRYLSAANDVWSLGVILVNLTCGRNPWKRASEEDPTFKAYQKDSGFLKTILPIHDELNDILRAIFEVNPQKRMTVSQLIARMERCPKLTQSSQTPLTPPESPVDTFVDSCSKDSMDIDSSIAALRLPPPRYVARPAQYHHYPTQTHQSLHSYTAGSAVEYNHYTTQARTQYAYAAEVLAAQQYWNGWNTCNTFSSQQCFYPSTTPAFSAVY